VLVQEHEIKCEIVARSHVIHSHYCGTTSGNSASDKKLVTVLL